MSPSRARTRRAPPSRMRPRRRSLPRQAAAAATRERAAGQGRSFLLGARAARFGAPAVTRGHPRLCAVRSARLLTGARAPPRSCLSITLALRARTCEGVLTQWTTITWRVARSHKWPSRRQSARRRPSGNPVRLGPPPQAPEGTIGSGGPTRAHAPLPPKGPSSRADCAGRLAIPYRGRVETGTPSCRGHCHRFRWDAIACRRSAVGRDDARACALELVAALGLALDSPRRRCRST